MFEIVGAMPNAVQDLWRKITSEFFPTSDYEPTYEMDIEAYTAGVMTDPNYKSEIWVKVNMIKTLRRLGAPSVERILYANIKFVSWMLGCENCFLFTNTCMGVNLRCCYRTVTKHLLDIADVHIFFKQ